MKTTQITETSSIQGLLAKYQEEFDKVSHQLVFASQSVELTVFSQQLFEKESLAFNETIEKIRKRVVKGKRKYGLLSILAASVWALYMIVGTVFLHLQAIMVVAPSLIVGILLATFFLSYRISAYRLGKMVENKNEYNEDDIYLEEKKDEHIRKADKLRKELNVISECIAILNKADEFIVQKELCERENTISELIKLYHYDIPGDVLNNIMTLKLYVESLEKKYRSAVSRFFKGLVNVEEAESLYNILQPVANAYARYDHIYCLALNMMKAHVEHNTGEFYEIYNQLATEGIFTQKAKVRLMSAV